MLKITKLIILVTLILSIGACSEQGPHADNVLYVFKVKYSKSEYTDRLTLERKSTSGFQSDIIWDSEIRQDKGSINGITVETKSSNSTQNFELPQPLGEYLNLTNLLPAPRVEFPISIGDSIYLSHKVDYKHSPYNGRQVDGYLTVSGKEYYSNDTCWVINAYKLTTNDTSATYYYSPKYGFIYFKYQLGEDTIEIDLDSLTTSN